MARLMKQLRVTKFDSAKRNADGTYSDQQEWTCISEIGKDCGGTVLTPHDYLQTENRYVNAVLRFFRASGLPHLRVTNFSNNFTRDELAQQKKKYPFLQHASLDSLNFAEDQTVGPDEIALLVVQNLRGTLNCKLEIEGAFFAHFGWDYYMYLGCSGNCERARIETEADGMFVEDFISPHARPVDSAIPMTILISDKLVDFEMIDGEPEYYIGSEVIVPNVDWRKVLAAFDFSDEHPFFGSYEIDAKVGQRLIDEFGLALDTEGCELTLNTTGC